MGIYRTQAAILLSVIQGAGATVLAQDRGFGDDRPGFGENPRPAPAGPLFRVEVLAFAYNAFDPNEERFPEEPAPTLPDTRPPEFLVTAPPEPAHPLPPTAMPPDGSESTGPTLGGAAGETTETGAATETAEASADLPASFAQRLIAGLLLLEEPSEAPEPPDSFDSRSAGSTADRIVEGIESSPRPDTGENGSAENGSAESIFRFDPLESSPRPVAGEQAAREAAAAENEPTVPRARPVPEPAAERPRPLFRVLRADELELHNALRTLDRVAAYTPLAHGGWVQAALSPERAVPLDLSRLGVVNPVGTVQLHLSRFLHVTVDLVYRAQPRSPPAQVSTPGDVLEELNLPPRHALRVQRRVRTGEIHYFDHPAVGLLVVIQRQSAEAEDAAESLSAPDGPAA